MKAVGRSKIVVVFANTNIVSIRPVSPVDMLHFVNTG